MLRFAFYSILLLFVVAVTAVGAALWYLAPQLPSVETLGDVHLQTPLRVYAADGGLIAEFGEKKRDPVDIAAVPELMKQAFIAAEDDRFYDHPGVDWIAIVRATFGLLQTGQKKQGGSTITMQVARNFFLTPEKTYERKLKEIMLAVKIERELSKQQILELYLNKIFLGHRAYGVGAAAKVYYGKDLGALTLGQIAMIAGLPKAPSRTNPITSPKSARARRTYVLGRMLSLGYIDRRAYEEADREPLPARVYEQEPDTPAPYVAEMVREYMNRQYGDRAYTRGFRVYTTVSSPLQAAATEAHRKALVEYDRRHGYRGVEAHVDIPPGAAEVEWAELLDGQRTIGALRAALVLDANAQQAQVFARELGVVTIPWAGLRWAAKYFSPDARGTAPRTTGEVVGRGDIVRIEWVAAPSKPAADGTPAPADAGYWRLAQVPRLEGALVSLDVRDGAILALVGGLDFERSKFNRVTQARRQPGSNFKPFIYSAALEHGFTPASFINDAPIVFDAPGLETAWRPQNYSGTYLGPTRLRVALAQSRNLVSVRLLQAIGVRAALEYVARFGFDAARLPGNLSLALGSGELTPLEVVAAYAVFANGGYRVEPYFVRRIETLDGEHVTEADPATVCAACDQVALDEEGEPVDLDALVAITRQTVRKPAKRVLDARNAWIMNSMLQGVIKTGTGRGALQLNRGDVAGKTGTTNEQKDAWFSGFNGRIATTVWVGFDHSDPLGRQETGARAALPMWVDYMRTALADTPEEQMERPPGLVTVRIDPDTGLLTGAGNPNGIFETLRQEDVPIRDHGALEHGGGTPDSGLPVQLF